MLSAGMARWPSLLLVGLVTTSLSQPATSLITKSVERDGSYGPIAEYTTSPPPPPLEGDDLNLALPEMLKEAELLQAKLHNVAAKLRKTRNHLRQVDGYISRLTINLTRSAQNLARADNLANGNLERTGWLDQKATVFNGTLKNVTSGVAEIEEMGNRTMNATLGLSTHDVKLVENFTRAEQTIKLLTPGTKEYKIGEAYQLLDDFEKVVTTVVDGTLNKTVVPLLGDHSAALKNLSSYTTAEWRREQLGSR